MPPSSSPIVRPWTTGSLRVVLQRVKDIAHGLAGSGGVFGFDLLSDKAAKLEDAAAACLMEGGGVDAVKLAISALLLEIDATPLD